MNLDDIAACRPSGTAIAAEAAAAYGVAERRHFEMMAATIAAGLVAYGSSDGDSWPLNIVPKKAIMLALRIHELIDASQGTQP